MSLKAFRRAGVVIAAGLLVSLPVGQQLSKHRAEAQASKTDQKLSAVHQTAKISGIPNRILIPRLGIDLPVVVGSQTNSGWSVAPSNANWADQTARANNYHGQTLIYGHNNRRVFGSTLSLNPGDTAYVYTVNGHSFKYAFSSSEDISPYAKDVFSRLASSGPGLVLMTCDGQAFQFRHFMTFSLVKSS